MVSAIVPARRRAEVLDITPSRPQIVRSGRESAPRLCVHGESRIVPARRVQSELLVGERPLEKPPEWFEPDVRQGTRIAMWCEYSPEERERLLAQDSALSVRAPGASDEIVLLSQYHALKALAVLLDAGVGTERDRAMFEAGLREYNATYNRIQGVKRLTAYPSR